MDSVSSGYTFRSSRPEVFFKKGVLKNFAKFAGKYLCQSIFFNKVAGYFQGRGLQLYSKRTLAQVFSYEFCEIFKNTFCSFIKKGTPAQVFSCKICEIFLDISFTEHFRWLLLKRPELSLTVVGKNVSPFLRIIFNLILLCIHYI